MKYSKKDISLIGASLYLCEGTNKRICKRRNGNKHEIFAVEFTNKDSRAILAFLKFLREIIQAEENRIKAELFIYPDHNEEKLIKYWSDLTRIPLDRFNKTIYLKQKNLKLKPNPFGTLKIRYHHKEHFLKIQRIISDIFDFK